MTNEELADIRERADKATPGPWMFETEFDDDDPPEGHIVTDALPDYPKFVITDTGCLRSDADFIVHAREDVPALLAYIDELERENSQLRDEVSHQS